ncbi:MAG: 4-(cytidine 5'-diphospho)-2-C-methyl-D-erythritol kinase [Bacteroides sp.]
MITFPNSKINLGLNITETRPDGYHNLETVFYPIPLQDALEVTTREKLDKEYELFLTGTPINGEWEDNLVVKAYRLLKSHYDIPPINIYMYKHIPIEAGLGGGSADAAYMIKLLNDKYKLNISTALMEEYAGKLGADCAFFIQNKPVFATGVGNVFEPINLSLKGYFLLLIKPDISVSTRNAFATITPQKPKISLKEIVCQPIETWKDCMINDFEAGAVIEHPEISAVKDKIYDLGAVYASMTGSGSAVYGIFRVALPEVDHLFPGCFCRQRELA